MPRERRSSCDAGITGSPALGHRPVQQKMRWRSKGAHCRLQSIGSIVTGRPGLTIVMLAVLPKPSFPLLVDVVTLLCRATEAGDAATLPFLLNRVPCGFPSPAEDHQDDRLDLLKRLVRNPASTFFARAQGESMIKAGILTGAILVIDRSLHPAHGDIVLAVLGSEFTCKRLYVRDGRFLLVPESDDRRFRPIEPAEGEEVTVWGVVTSVVNEFRRNG